MKTLVKTLILVALFATFTKGPMALANEGAKPSVTPTNELDSWDDDVWADWGAPPANNKVDDKNNATDANAKDNTNNGAGTMTTTDSNVASSGGLSGANGFGESSDKIKFHLVRDGENSGPQGVRKYRPTYGKRRSL